MSVHKALSEHSKKQNKRIMDFMQLDQKRELLIDEAVTACKNNNPYDVDGINKVTGQINELARLGIVPQRKLVTKEMVAEYAKRNL